MKEAAFQLLTLCFFLLYLVTAGLSVFAFSDSKHFVEWLWPLHWSTRKIWGDRASQFDRYWALAAGVFLLSIVFSLALILGSWMTTIMMGLWSSPIYRLLDS